MAGDPGLILGATALGGAISIATTYAMARRGERTAARALNRLLRDDLTRALNWVLVALDDQEWWIRGFSLPTRSWNEDRRPLALVLSDTDWRIVARAFMEMEVTNWALAELRDDPLLTDPIPLAGPGATRRLEMTRDAVLSAIATLERFERSWLRRSHQSDAARLTT